MKHDDSQSTVQGELERYEKAAKEHRQASRAGDHKTANCAYRRLSRSVQEIKRIGPSAQRAFLSLLDNQDVAVRGWAAATALEFAPELAEPILEEIACGPKSLEEFSARMVLQQWRSGSLKFV